MGIKSLKRYWAGPKGSDGPRHSAAQAWLPPPARRLTRGTCMSARENRRRRETTARQPRNSPTASSPVNPTAPACSPRPPASIAPLKLDSNGLPGCRPWPTAARPWRTVVLRRTPTVGGHTRHAQALGKQGGPSYATASGYGEAVRRDRVRSPAATMAAMPRWCMVRQCRSPTAWLAP